MEHPSDFNELCRLCATKTTSQNRLQMFHSEDKFRSILLKISSCLPVEILEEDFLPKMICKDCVNSVESYYEFRSICVKTELFLKNLLNESRQIVEMYCKEVNEVQIPPGTFVPETFDKLDWSVSEEVVHLEIDPVKNVDSVKMLRDNAESIICEPSIYIKDVKSCNAVVKDSASIGSNSIILHESSLIKSPSSLFRCHYCKLIFPTHKESIDHLKLEHKKIHKCDVCNESFRSVEALAVHKEKYLQQSREKEVLIENKKRKLKIAEMQNKCKECGKQYKRTRELRLHERSHTGEKPFACKYCDKTFAASSSRNKHVQVHEKRWSHVCSFCGKGFVDKIHFTYHVQKQHTGERPFACSQCDKKFVRKQDLKMHKVNFHSTKPRQCYKCDVCNNVYTTMSYLRQHKQIHEMPLESRKKFKCDICNSVFLTKNKLKQHTLNHTGELPFECEICKKRYSSKMGLKIHLLIHSGIKKYVCEICSKPFALRNSLVCHRRTHTGERPYQCDICHQHFTQKSSLNTHRKRHSREDVSLTPTWQISLQTPVL